MQWFDTIDRNRSGTLDVKELQAALALGNLHFSLKAVAHMIRCVHASMAVALVLDHFTVAPQPKIFVILTVLRLDIRDRGHQG